MSDRRPLISSFHFPVADVPSGPSSHRVQALTRTLLALRPPGLTDVVPGYTNVMVEFDARLTTKAELQRLLETAVDHGDFSPGRQVQVPVRYDGPDLEQAAAALNMTPAELVERHSRPEYLVHAVGFTPGFPFMGVLEPELRLPRRDRPRAAVLANSVAIADMQTGIYPLRSPGGWHLLGTSLVPVYTPTAASPFLLEPGDTVRFVPATGPEPDEPQPLELLPQQPLHPFLRVLEPGLLDLVVDGGRYLAGRYGLARSGAVDPVSASTANLLLGNGPFDPLLEISVAGPTLEVLRDGVVAFAGWGVSFLNGNTQVEPFTSHAVSVGDVLRFPAQSVGTRAYLAVAGAIQAARHLGSASPDMQGLIGRALKAGDLLGTAAVRSVVAGRSFVPRAGPGLPGRIRLLRGPQFSDDAAAALSEGTFTVAAGNRMGIQLDGPDVPGGQVVSEGNPLGAIQVTPGGQPIILLNDRGTLGGYTKPAVVHPADLSRVAQLRQHERVRFRFVDD